MKYLSYIFILGLLIQGNVYGKLVRRNFESVRYLGMGNAGLALSDDHNVLWYNPAGLARIRGGHFNVFDFTTGFDSMDTMNRMKDAITTANTANLLRTDKQMMRIGLRPTFLSRFFSLSFYDHFYGFYDLGALSAPTDMVDLYAFNDIGAIMGFGIPLSPLASFGASVRAFQRYGMDINSDILSVATDLNLNPLTAVSDLQTGTFGLTRGLMGTGIGVGINAGFLLHVPLPKDYPKWNISLSAEDIGNTKFAAIGSEAPPSIPMTVHFGTSFTYTLPNSAKLNLTMDYRNFFNDDVSMFSKLHMGMEYRHTKWFSLRTGLYQMRPCFGFSIETPPHTRFHFATYEVELDNSLWGRGQRAFVFQVVIGFNPI